MTALLFAAVAWLAPTNAPPPDALMWDGPSPDQIATWDRVADCESGGQWDLNVGAFDGGLQWLPGTWLAWKNPEDPPYAYLADRLVQIGAADRLRLYEVDHGRGGYGPWPGCAKRLRLPR